MGPNWVLSAPGRPHVGPTNLAIWVTISIYPWFPCESTLNGLQSTPDMVLQLARRVTRNAPWSLPSHNSCSLRTAHRHFNPLRAHKMDVEEWMLYWLCVITEYRKTVLFENENLIYNFTKWLLSSFISFGMFSRSDHRIWTLIRLE